MTHFQSAPDGNGLRVCILASRFNLMVTDRLVDGAREALLSAGVADSAIDVVSVPGAWELPLAALAATTRGYDAIVAVGCIIRGQTAHFEHLGRAAVDGLARVQEDTGVPIGLGILTPEDLQQALARAGGEVGHAGTQAAEAALEQAALLARLRRDDG
ncbi:MAG: 6,7-dimethyl-8-ribityllumazine synthase [Gemmatimonadota bacterium]|nr:6,7-dimethyl-8-ribityllumazine synthase [Gemmatimonadota bacterium]